LVCAKLSLRWVELKNLAIEGAMRCLFSNQHHLLNGSCEMDVEQEEEEEGGTQHQGYEQDLSDLV